MTPPDTFLQLHSLVTPDGTLRLSLARLPTPAPGPDDILVRVEATPINPSDLGLLLGAADPQTARRDGEGDAAIATVTIPPGRMPAMAGRVGEAMPVGNEGAGTVVQAGASDAAQALLGRKVAIVGGALYAQYRCVPAAAAMPLPDGATAADGASCFVNPLTALGMVETMRLENHTALVHTAAASNLGQMLVRICLADGVPLVNIVRSQAQAALLRGLGAEYVVDSTAPDFSDALRREVAVTRATLGFDAIGGGPLAGQILSAMEAAMSRATEYSRYGSSVHKQVYIYGALDLRPTELARDFGLTWGVGGWLLTPFLGRIGGDGRRRLQARVAAELKTTFASHYTRAISLHEALEPDTLRAYARRATGEKFLINPSLSTPG